MRIGPLHLEWHREKASPPTGTTQLPSGWGSSSSWFGAINESYPGAWQNGVTEKAPIHVLTSFGAVYACISLISDDISKLRIKLMQPEGDVWREVKELPPLAAVLRKPNPYQTRVQFLSQWVQSKLVHGNAYVFLERDLRGVVVAMYVLNPRLVTVMVDEEGGVWYQLSQDKLNSLKAPIMVPATDMISDRAVCLFHPLIGVSPLHACALSASQGSKIQATASQFFENHARPSGVLTFKRALTDEKLKEVQRGFQQAFGGANIGKVLISDTDTSFVSLGSLMAADAQLCDQLSWTALDVARCYRVPPHKLGLASDVKFSNMSALDDAYYSQTLQVAIEAIEILLDEALGLAKAGFRSELDLSGLLRMDPVAKAEVHAKLVQGGVLTPNEVRAEYNRSPIPGGEHAYLQRQNAPLQILATEQPADASGDLAKSIAPVMRTMAATLTRMNQRMDAQEAKHVEH